MVELITFVFYVSNVLNETKQIPGQAIPGEVSVTYSSICAA
jgi:hypothetical protein